MEVTADRNDCSSIMVNDMVLEMHLIAAMFRLCASSGLRHVLVSVGPRRPLAEFVFETPRTCA
jgi:hypothetical protein